jgi:hypothetical protein
VCHRMNRSRPFFWYHASLIRCGPWTMHPSEDASLGDSLDDAFLGQCIPQTMHPLGNPLDDAYLGRSLERCATGRMHPLDRAALGPCISWTMRLLDDASLERCISWTIPWTMRPLDDPGRYIPEWAGLGL